MSAREAKFMRIDDRRKFATLAEAEKEADRIKENVARNVKKKDYAVVLLIGISEHCLSGKKEVLPHLHTMYYGEPADTIGRLIVSCINKYEKKHGRKRAATRHSCDVKYARYINEQSDKYRTLVYDPHHVLGNVSRLIEEMKADLEAFRKKRRSKHRQRYPWQGLGRRRQPPYNYNGNYYSSLYPFCGALSKEEMKSRYIDDFDDVDDEDEDEGIIPYGTRKMERTTDSTSMSVRKKTEDTSKDTNTADTTPSTVIRLQVSISDPEILVEQLRQLCADVQKQLDETPKQTKKKLRPKRRLKHTPSNTNSSVSSMCNF